MSMVARRWPMVAGAVTARTGAALGHSVRARSGMSSGAIGGMSATGCPASLAPSRAAIAALSTMSCIDPFLNPALAATG